MIAKIKSFILQRKYFFLGKNAQKCLIFSQQVYGRPRDPAVGRYFCQIGRSEICLVHEGISNLQNFAQISIVASIFAQEINFLQSQNWNGCYHAFMNNDLMPQ